MPHISVKLWPGRSEEQKRSFADAVVSAAAEHLKADPAWLTLAIEEIDPARWERDVVIPEIRAKEDKLYFPQKEG